MIHLYHGYSGLKQGGQNEFLEMGCRSIRRQKRKC